MLALFGSAVVAYWPLSDLSGVPIVDIGPNHLNGEYTGVSLGEPGIGDGRTCPFFDGVNDYANTYNLNLDAVFNKAEFSVFVAFKVKTVDVWSDGLWAVIQGFAADVNNYIWINKQTDGTLTFSYGAGGTAKFTGRSIGTPVTWQFAAITVSKSADQFKGYSNGVQLGTTQNGLGVWVGALALIRCNAGARTTTPSNTFMGWIAHTIVLNRAATPAEVAKTARL
jgi:hypothetical protein